MARKHNSSDVTSNQWAFVAQFLTLMRADAPQRQYDLGEVFSSWRFNVRAGAPWRYVPNISAVKGYLLTG